MWRAGARLGECPRWDPRSERLFWVDIRSAELHALQPCQGKRQTWKLPYRALFAGRADRGLELPPHRNAGGEMFVGCGDLGLAWIAVEDDAVRMAEVGNPERDQSENRFNDGRMGPDGRYWAGTMHEPGELATGSLYAFRADGTYDVLDRGYRVTNGPAFSPDGSVVYHSDSARAEVYAFDLTGDSPLDNKRVFVRFAGEGHPDGMTTDRHGHLWVAMWDGGRVERLSPGGASPGERFRFPPADRPRARSWIPTAPRCSSPPPPSARRRRPSGRRPVSSWP